MVVAFRPAIVGAFFELDNFLSRKLRALLGGKEARPVLRELVAAMLGDEWVVTLGGIAATAVAGWRGPSWTALGVPIAVACGALVGLANGLGVAFLRIPSMVFTLGMNAVVQGMVVMYTGGSAPPDQATRSCSGSRCAKRFTCRTLSLSGR